MNPAEIALKNMHLVLKVAAALFVFGIGLDIFGYSRFKIYVNIFAIAALAVMVISALSGFMGAAESVSNGTWPK